MSLKKNLEILSNRFSTVTQCQPFDVNHAMSLIGILLERDKKNEIL